MSQFAGRVASSTDWRFSPSHPDHKRRNYFLPLLFLRLGLKSRSKKPVDIDLLRPEHRQAICSPRCRYWSGASSHPWSNQETLGRKPKRDPGIARTPCLSFWAPKPAFDSEGHRRWTPHFWRWSYQHSCCWENNWWSPAWGRAQIWLWLGWGEWVWWCWPFDLLYRVEFDAI